MFEVNGTKWNIILVDANSKHLRRSDGSYTIGVCDNFRKTIYIYKHLDSFMFDKVLAHEMTHVFCFEFDLSLDIDTEEIIADFISLYGRKIVYMVDDIVKTLSYLIS